MLGKHNRRVQDHHIRCMDILQCSTKWFSKEPNTCTPLHLHYLCIPKSSEDRQRTYTIQANINDIDIREVLVDRLFEFLWILCRIAKKDCQGMIQTLWTSLFKQQEYVFQILIIELIIHIWIVCSIVVRSIIAPQIGRLRIPFHSQLHTSFHVNWGENVWAYKTLSTSFTIG